MQAILRYKPQNNDIREWFVESSLIPIGNIYELLMNIYSMLFQIKYVYLE